MNRLAALVVPATLAGVLATGALAVAPPPRVALPGDVPSWAVPGARLRDARDAETAEVQVLLPLRPGARALAEAVSDPADPAYGRHLTAAEFRARFSPPATLVKATQRWLASAGLELGEVPANRLVVPARGTVAQLERAFGVTLGEYAGPEGTVLRAPDRAPSVIAGAIGVRGLDESHQLLRPGAFDEDPPPPLPADEPATPADTAPPNAVVYGAPCSAYHGERVDKRLPARGGRKHPAVTCATSPHDLRAAYGVTPHLVKGIDGRGETIVMVGSHAIKQLPSDVATWSKRHRVAVPKAGQIRQVSYPGAYQTPSDPSESYLRPKVWAVQASTLFETMHTIAPGADLLYVGSTSSLDLPTATLQAVDLEYGDVVMNGWYSAGENTTDANIRLITEIATQAAATGISLLFASGDLGDNTRSGGTEGPVYPAHNPLVTSVGATSLILGKGGRYVTELGWAKSQAELDGGEWVDDLDATFRGSGGGVSAKFPQPAYQKGIVPGSMASGRAVPDIAVMGDAETGMLIGYTQTFPDGKVRYSERRVASGTASTALFAGMIAIANQQAKRNLGFVNPALYALRKAKPQAFRDIVPSGRYGGGVRIDHLNGASGETRTLLKTFEDFTSNVPARGYDTNTGLGSPSPAFLSLFR